MSESDATLAAYRELAKTRGFEPSPEVDRAARMHIEAEEALAALRALKFGYIGGPEPALVRAWVDSGGRCECGLHPRAGGLALASDP
jgi:hypothetical protein